jgi:hypothetical protein
MYSRSTIELKSMMLKPVLNRSSYWAIIALATISIAPLGMPSASLAQDSSPTSPESSNVQPLDNFPEAWGTSNERDSLTGVEPGGFDVYDLLNRVRFDRGRSVGEFVTDQEESLSQDATDFRARQLELIRRQRQLQQSDATIAPVESSTP